MRYDLMALFYEKKGDKKPRYNVPMGLIFPHTSDFFTEKGFIEDPESTPGYLDYIKQDVTEEDLQDLTVEGYVSEMLEVLSCGPDFERIDIQAMELDVIDDEGTIPPRGFFVGKIFVKLGETEYESPVVFINGDPYKMTARTKVTQIHLGALKRHFGVLTQNEVGSKLKNMKEDRWHNFKELEQWIRKLMESEPRTVTVYRDDDTVKGVTVTIEDGKFQVDQQDLASEGSGLDRWLTASSDEVKAALGMEIDSEVLRWFAANFYEEDAFDRIGEWLEENKINRDYYDC